MSGPFLKREGEGVALSGPAVGLVETTSIARGLVVADAMAKRAPITLSLVRPVTPGKHVVIIQVSRMEAWKGHQVCLEALTMLRDVPGWTCWQVGGAQRRQEERYLDRLRAFATQHDIASRVRFLGERTDVPRLLGAADIYCQPNTAPESFGITFVEALSAGIPVVTTAMGGALEIVDETCGLLVPPRDAQALAAALRRLLGDEALRIRLGRQARIRRRELCDPATQIRRICEMLASLVRPGSLVEAPALPDTSNHP